MIDHDTDTDKIDLPDAALAYARLGWRVMPLHHLTPDGICSCEKGEKCGRSTAKHPRIKKWTTTGPSIHPHIIRGWWRTWPLANIGILTGPESGIFVLDTEEEGLADLAALEEANGPLPHTPRSVSGNGGLHDVFRWPTDGRVVTSGSHVNKKPIDTRGRGGQFVVAPSRNAGGRYRWLVSPFNVQPAEAPEWLLALLEEHGRVEVPSNGKPRKKFVLKATRTLTVEERAVLYLEKCPAAIDGEGGSAQTFHVARAIVYGFDLGKERGFELLRDHYNPRCKGEWSEKELRHKCEDADRKPFKKPRGYLLADGARTQQSSSDGNEPPATSQARTTEAASTITFGNYAEVGKHRLAYSPDHIAKQLQRIAPGWPKCVSGELVVVEAGHQPRYLDNPDALFAWIVRQLPTSDSNPIRWATQGKNLVSTSRFFAYLKQTAEQYEALAPFPHWPEVPGTLYVHPPLQGGDGAALRVLLSRFQPASAEDRALILAVLLTLVWGGRPGSRPGWLITRHRDTSDKAGRGIGKSTLVHQFARLIGGHVELDKRAKRDEIATRLLSEAGLARRVVLLDNVKDLRLSWDELEGFITSPVISGHQMYVGEGQCPNRLNWFITLNGAGLSKDLAQRCVPIWLARPAYSATWREEVEQFIDGHRWEIIGDLIALLKGPAAETLSVHSRWGAWEEEVLSRVEAPEEAQKVIHERQADLDADEEEADLVRAAFVTRLAARLHNPERDVVKIPACTAAAWLCQALGEKMATNRASQRLRNLEIAELRKSDRGQGRGWVWHGAQAIVTAAAVDLNEEPVNWTRTAES
jgi:hypothetical protein